MNLLTITHLLNGLIMVALGIGLGIAFTRRFTLPWRLYLIGAATFILSQVGHIPFNAWLDSLFQSGALVLPAGVAGMIVNAGIAGLSAGLWEECARYAMYRWWARTARSWREGLTIGAGHGGVEAVILGALVLWTFIQAFALRDMDLTTVASGEQLEQIKGFLAQYWTANWYDTLLGAVERLFTLPLHLACSLLVLRVFQTRQIYWLGLAVGWHALADAAVVFVLTQTGNVYWTEALVAVFGVTSVLIVLALKGQEPPEMVDAPVEAHPLPAVDIKPVEETPENLEKSRYNS